MKKKFHALRKVIENNKSRSHELLKSRAIPLIITTRSVKTEKTGENKWSKLLVGQEEEDSLRWRKKIPWDGGIDSGCSWFKGNKMKKVVQS